MWQNVSPDLSMILKAKILNNFWAKFEQKLEKICTKFVQNLEVLAIVSDRQRRVSIHLGVIYGRSYKFFFTCPAEPLNLGVQNTHE